MRAVLLKLRVLQACAVAGLLLTLTYLFLGDLWSTPSYATPWQSPVFFLTPPGNITQDMDILKELGLTLPAQFKYQRYCVEAHEERSVHRQSVIKFADQILAEPSEIEVARDFVPGEDDETLFPPCEATVALSVPEFSTRAARSSTEALMLGVATTLSRIADSLPTFSRWLSSTGSPLVVLLVDQQDLESAWQDIQRVNQTAIKFDIELIFEPYHPMFDFDSEGLKNFGLASVLDLHRRPETKWFGIIDDDTFFLSLYRMLEALELYNPEEQWYIGALTEGHTRLAQEGFKAWGGAGFFISFPLMQILAENAIECTHLDKFFGDMLWRDCIMECTSPTVHLTEMRGLNQMDLWKDLAGWYEAGFNPLLTIHHWKSWHYFPVEASHLVTDVAGPDSMLQRYQFGNKTVFTNGYSMVEYPRGMPDLNLVELTMTEDVNIDRHPEALEFHHSMGKTRPALHRGQEKLSWTFEHALITADGTVRQFYVSRPDSGPPQPDLYKSDISIIEVDWRHG